jgi:hypothetical protein
LKFWPNSFIEFVEVAISASTESYDLPVEIMYSNKLVSVQYSHNGEDQYYHPLEPVHIMNRRGIEGYPTHYFRIGKSIFLQPIPQTSGATLRAAYYRRLDDLDIKRATINGTPAGAAIAVETTGGYFLDTYGLVNGAYVCVTDIDGNVLLRNGRVLTFLSPTLTLADDVATYLEPGYALADLDGAFITLGKNTTTLSRLPDECERYLRVYTQKRILTVNESNSSVEEDQELKGILQDILQNYGDEDRDIVPWPVSDWELMS